MTDTLKAGQALHLLAAINRLGLKSYNSPNQQSLIFTILNDTVQIVPYHRAVMWRIEKQKPTQLLGVSGQSTINQHSDLAKAWFATIQAIPDPENPHILSFEQLNKVRTVEVALHSPTVTTSVLWMPIFSHDKLTLGLWLERWNGGFWQHDEIEILAFLMKNYGAAWDKFSRKDVLHKVFNRPVGLAVAAIVALILFIPIPLRVIAPCEIVAKDPILITAPLDGIIKEIKVQPGQMVKKGEILFEYDKQVPLDELKVAQKQVQMSEADLARANSLAFTDKKALSEYGVLSLKLKKALAQLHLEDYKVSQLDVRAPINGVVMIDHPDEFNGNPIHLGEKVMTISNPNQTKIRIWVPENDNITLNKNKNVKIILNIDPEDSYSGNLTYIASYTVINDKSVPSFVAEADWVKKPTDIKLGLKGTAILYGENVSIFYWIVRRPWTSARRFLGF